MYVGGTPYFFYAVVAHGRWRRVKNRWGRMGGCVVEPGDRSAELRLRADVVVAVVVGVDYGADGRGEW